MKHQSVYIVDIFFSDVFQKHTRIGLKVRLMSPFIPIDCYTTDAHSGAFDCIRPQKQKITFVSPLLFLVRKTNRGISGLSPFLDGCKQID
ncbi:hypothetical protein ACTXT7_003816 [Hymenolepis weldensis]